ncbi:MAG TPA: ornithine carbamoyltransferase [Candidatus Binatia bacterium]|nr:ornithine carbamoyltransferase [Candidatus Binatia bacterium]
MSASAVMAEKSALLSKAGRNGAAAAAPPFAKQAGAAIFSDVVSTRDLGPEGVHAVLNLAAVMKSRPADFRRALAGRQMVMFFEKPSLRTRLTFESGMNSLGGTAMFVDQTHERLDAREKLSDVAHNLERWVDVIVLRTFSQQLIADMAQYASVPVINALSDVEHPCQALADFLTLRERFGDVKDICVAYVGDGNNVAHSLVLTAACLGSSVRVATPEGYEPSGDILAAAREIAQGTGASIELMNDPQKAVAGAHAVYTDAWVSMGQERDSERREKIFPPYQVNAELMAKAAPRAVFMHCLPAHRGLEVTDEVMDSAQSLIFEQAENRLHAQKAVLYLLLGNGSRRPARSAHV